MSQGVRVRWIKIKGLQTLKVADFYVSDCVFDGNNLVKKLVIIKLKTFLENFLGGFSQITSC